MNRHSVVVDVNVKTAQELLDLYGIRIEEDGRVLDPYDFVWYDSVYLWAAAMDENDNNDHGGFTKGSGKQKYWDE